MTAVGAVLAVLVTLFGLAFLSVLVRRAVRRRNSARAVPPENVRIVRADGSTVPLELLYRGRYRGIDQWAATTTVPVLPGDQMHARTLPARCEVTLWLELPIRRTDES